MREAGFTVEVRNTNNLNPVKERLGVPYGKGSCHTAAVGGYVVEGHVPADDVKRLLAQQLAAQGWVLSGMPLASPGLQMPGCPTDPYKVALVPSGGTPEPYARSSASPSLRPV